MKRRNFIKRAGVGVGSLFAMGLGVFNLLAKPKSESGGAENFCTSYIKDEDIVDLHEIYKRSMFYKSVNREMSRFMARGFMVTDIYISEKVYDEYFWGSMLKEAPICGIDEITYADDWEKSSYAAEKIVGKNHLGASIKCAGDFIFVKDHNVKNLSHSFAMPGEGIFFVGRKYSFV